MKTTKKPATSPRYTTPSLVTVNTALAAAVCAQPPGIAAPFILIAVVAGFLALGPCTCVNAQPGSPMQRMPRISPPTPVYTPPPVRPYAPPTFPRYSGPPIQTLPPSAPARQVPDPTMRQLRDQMNLNQMQSQQRQVQAAAAAANRRWQDEASHREAQERLNGMQTQARVARSSGTPLSLAQTSGVGLAGSIKNGTVGQTNNQPGNVTRFKQAATNSIFYFPNDPQRRSKWVKISPTMARSLVNGRTIVLPIATTVIVAGGPPYFSGFGPGQQAGQPNPPQVTPYASPAVSNTFRVSNPNEYDAAVSLRSDSQNTNLNVKAHSAASVQLPDGTYQIFFQFSDQPGQRFQGDDVSLQGNIAELKLVHSVDGNYGLRQID